MEKFNNILFESIKGKTRNYATAYTVFASAMDSILQPGNSKPFNDFNDLSRKYDCKNLSADFLIRNIEYAFMAWQNNPWAKDVSFEDFCTYVLPYRAGSEPVDIDRQKLYAECTEIAYAAKDTNDPKVIFDYILNRKFIKYHRLVESKYPWLMSMKDNEALGIGSCVHAAIYNTNLLRSIGLPVAVDYTPNWGNYKGNHYMPVLITAGAPDALLTNNNSDNTAVNSRFEMSFSSGISIPEDSLPPGFSIQYIKTIPKIFRKTGMIQPERRYLLDDPDMDKTGMFSDLCDKDVTDEYLECSDITIKVNGENKNEKIAYLCVFNGDDRIPVHAAPVKKGKVAFKKMGRMIVYLPAIYDRGIMKPISRPFYFTEKGKLVIIKSDRQKTSKIKLVSKYPLFSYAAGHAYRMKGGRFQGANSPDFKDAETLYEIDHYPFYNQEIKINNEKEFRYYGYIAPNHVTYAFAELCFYTSSMSDTIPMQGHWFDEFKSDPELFRNLGDNDLNTSVTGIPRPVSRIGFDAGENNKARLTKIRFAPLNDANCIIPGKVYELFYWNGRQWSSLGKQTASSDHLVYDNAPQGALLWLRCHSEGKEERIFTWANEKQVWW